MSAQALAPRRSRADRPTTSPATVPPMTRQGCRGWLTCHRPAEACATCRITHPGTMVGSPVVDADGHPLEPRQLDPTGYQLACDEWASLPKEQSAPHPFFFWAPLAYACGLRRDCGVMDRVTEQRRQRMRDEIAAQRALLSTRPEPERTASVEQPTRVRELVRNAFEGHEITTFTFQGRPMVLASQVGEALGYAEKVLVDTLTSNWSDEAIEGKDWIRITNGNLRDLKAMLGAVGKTPTGENLTRPSPIPDRAAHVIALTESGFGFVCIKTEKPLGKKLRREWADRIFPGLMREGSPTAATPSPATSSAEVAELRAELGQVKELVTRLAEEARTPPPALPRSVAPPRSRRPLYSAEALARFVTHWADVARQTADLLGEPRPLRAAELVPLARDCGLLDDTGITAFGATMRLGKLLWAVLRDDQPVAGFRLRFYHGMQGNRYWLEG